MLSFLFKKENKVNDLLFEYLENLAKTQENFVKAMDVCFVEGVGGQFAFLKEQTHKFESKADDIKDEVNFLMYSRALIPESREDFMNLIEHIENIPRIFELILHLILAQKIKIPDFLVPEAKELIRVSAESCGLLIRQVTLMLNNENGTMELVKVIDQHESHCDHLERNLMTKLFESDIEPYLKLQIKELIVAMGEISDQAYSVAKFANIIVLKRRV
jgi:predicted phosphate transport protein (TIGR00153 family)